ncbi:MAG: response regulator transcription factor [Clostridia bacterium]|nr:response regulator transcription factor [Clostridia bacterium]
MTKCPLILISDDDPVVHESLGIYLDNENYQHISAFSGTEALQMAENENPNLIVLDLMMPGMNGIDVCRTIRQTSRVPIVILTAKGEEIDRILGLELGADDYIVKPFSPREVLARIKAVLRRFEEAPQETEKNIVRLPQLEVNLDNYQVRINGQIVPCTPKEVEILHMLTASPGQVFSREQILSRVWGYDYFGDTRTVDAHIKRIRQKLPTEGVPWELKTVYGVGYRFEVFGA